MLNKPKSIKFLVCIVFLGFFLACKGNEKEDKLNLLILTGSNNHDWKATTKELKRMYDETNKFQLHITKSPDTLDYNDFKNFDVVLSNWNQWPDNNLDWPESTKQGLMKYIEEGGGFVLFHAASATFNNWQEYHELIGGTWGKNTRHGKITEHKITFKDREHPITKGIKDFSIVDELWVEMELQDNVNVLATSLSDAKNKGRGVMEPVLLWNTRGKGRCFYNILGHNVGAIKNKMWETIMLRGTEWAATGKVLEF